MAYSTKASLFLSVSPFLSFFLSFFFFFFFFLKKKKEVFSNKTCVKRLKSFTRICLLFYDLLFKTELYTLLTYGLSAFHTWTG